MYVYPTDTEVRRDYDICLLNVAELHPLIQKNSVMGVIIRVFIGFDGVDETLEVLLIDEKGDRIQASLKKKFDIRIIPTPMQPLFLQEGDWILLVDFDLIPATGQFRLTPHEFMIECKKSTIIKKLPHGISVYKYNFSSFEDIKAGIVDPAFSVDLIGKVTNVGNLFKRQIIDAADRKQNVYLYLVNERGTAITVVMQRSHALDIVSRLMDYTETTVICVVRFARIRKSNGVWSALAVDQYSHVVLDPNVREANELRRVIVENEKT